MTLPSSETDCETHLSCTLSHTDSAQLISCVAYYFIYEWYIYIGTCIVVTYVH